MSKNEKLRQSRNKKKRNSLLKSIKIVKQKNKMVIQRREDGERFFFDYYKKNTDNKLSR